MSNLEKIFCSNCGAKINKQDNFCFSCGKKNSYVFKGETTNKRNLINDETVVKDKMIENMAV